MTDRTDNEQCHYYTRENEETKKQPNIIKRFLWSFTIFSPVSEDDKLKMR